MNVIISLSLLFALFQKLDAGTDECDIYGDPHFTTFDGQGHHYQGQGSSWYYVDDCDYDGNIASGGTPFRVKGKHRSCYGTASCLDYIEVDFYNEAGTAIANTIRLQADPDTLLTSVVVDGWKYSSNANGGINGNYGFGGFDVWEEGEGTIVLAARWTNTATDSDDLRIKLIAGTLTTGKITINDYYKEKVCGLCGQYDGSIDNDIHIREEIALTRRLRTLLDVNIIEFDNDGMNSWSAMSQGSEIWQRTFTFGDAWTTGEEIDTNTSNVYFPNIECIDEGTTFCTTLWDTEDVCNENCQLISNFIEFENWLQGCIYDSCAAATNDGTNLEGLTYDEAYNMGYLEASLESCDALCNTYRECPTECVIINDDGSVSNVCDCNDDSNCNICQPDSTNHCSQCKSGYFRKSDRNHACFPCQAYAGDGCMFCQDFNGCGQCSQGYTRVRDDDCGLWYCEEN